ncbi:hypothetical protein [Flintibacter muris]|uniref:hypothetical protein n=1 Tax=Flintibacter muris TaxID=2941327 RepID=UPI0020421735|nr:hypothetical protein [Flintibacter muris]
MKHKQWLWTILLFLGSAPFVFAFGFCFVTSLLDFSGVGFHKTSFLDYLLMWSFLYWPAYVVGTALIALSFVFRRKSS